MRNGATVIAQQLDALQTQITECTWEVIVADNGSTDTTTDVVTGHPIAKRVSTRLIDVPTPVGVNTGRNAGTAAATGDVVLICDCDDVASPSWIDGYWRQLRDAEPQIAAGPIEIEMLNHPKMQRWGQSLVAPTITEIGAPMGWGANIGFHRSVWSTLGGFDEAFTRGADDMDFFVRAWRDGIPLSWVDTAIMHYRLPERPVPLLRKVYAYGRGTARLNRAYPVEPAPQPLAMAVAASRTLARAIESGLRRRETTPQLVRGFVYQAGLIRGQITRRR